MRGEPDVASVAALIGDPSRAAMLAALADGRALPAEELAAAAGLSLSGASAQLASALEGLALLAVRPRRPRAPSPATEALRRARACCDHLAGELGVTLAQALEERCLVMAGEGKRLEVTAGGRQWLSQVLGIETARLVPGRHGIARRCLDWTNDGIISPAPWVPLCLIGSAN